MPLMSTPAEVVAALDDADRLAAVERFKTVDVPTEAIEAVLVDLATALGGDSFCAATYLDGRDQHFIATSDGPAEAMPREVSHCQYVISTGTWLCLNDASMPVGPFHTLRRAILRGEPIAAYLGFRLTFEGQTIGAVCAAGGRKRIWTPDEHMLVYRASTTVRDLIAERAVP